MKLRRSYHRRESGRRGVWVAILAALIVAGAVGVWHAVRVSAGHAYYQGYLVVGDPFVAVVREGGSDQLDIVNIPATVWINGLYGYGRYSLRSLWRLGRIDKRSGVVLRDSVSDALHVPLTGFIGENTDTLSGNTGGLSRLKNVFSLRRLPAIVFGTYEHDIGIIDFLRFWWHIRFLSVADVQTWDVRDAPYVRSQKLPDGTGIRVLDDRMLDTLFGNTFELDGIRRERYSVAVYNPTGIPGLGDRVAKMLSRIGVLVVSVGNADARLPRCELRVSADAEGSLTVGLLDELFGCRHIPNTQAERADISLTLGDVYAGRYR